MDEISIYVTIVEKQHHRCENSLHKIIPATVASTRQVAHAGTPEALSLATVASYENCTCAEHQKPEPKVRVFSITELDLINSIGRLLSITVGHIFRCKGYTP